MGRREVPLRSLDDCRVRFAADLRALRIASGEPTYRQMASRCHFSAATLARASSGRAMPSLEVTLAFVAACGGDPGVWRQRWEQARREHSATDQHIADNDESEAVAPEPSAPPRDAGADMDDGAELESEQAPVRALARKPRRYLLLSGLLVLSLALNAALLLGAGRKPGSPTVPAAHPTTPTRVIDGTDPEANHCDDAVNLDVEQIRLRSSAIIDGRHILAGTSLGTVSLRYSRRCAGAWARFDPADGLFHNPDQASVTLTAGRPADGSQNTWRLGHIDQTYSDLLLTGMGCVQASVTVVVFDGNATAEATTKCLPPMA